MKAIIVNMFDYEPDITDTERHTFANPINLKLVSDFIDLWFQMFDKPIDETFSDLNIRVDTIRSYQEKKRLPKSHTYRKSTGLVQILCEERYSPRDQFLTECVDWEARGPTFPFGT